MRNKTMNKKEIWNRNKVKIKSREDQKNKFKGIEQPNKNRNNRGVNKKKERDYKRQPSRTNC